MLITATVRPSGQGFAGRFDADCSELGVSVKRSTQACYDLCRVIMAAAPELANEGITFVDTEGKPRYSLRSIGKGAKTACGFWDKQGIVLYPHRPNARFNQSDT